MIRIELNIPQELIDKLESRREEIAEVLKQHAAKEAAKIKAGLHRDYNKAILDAFRRQYEPKQRKSIRVHPSEPPYIGGGVITSLEMGRRRKR